MFRIHVQKIIANFLEDFLPSVIIAKEELVQSTKAKASTLTHSSKLTNIFQSRHLRKNLSNNKIVTTDQYSPEKSVIYETPKTTIEE